MVPKGRALERDRWRKRYLGKQVALGNMVKQCRRRFASAVYDLLLNTAPLSKSAYLALKPSDHIQLVKVSGRSLGDGLAASALTKSFLES
ncbi:hypothetical protein [Pseudomonas sp.]|uniref:hypothetical protein n=1 Tax=Pseudomonas sp. TaxID=306 RepID=UPI0027350BB1|nr:hypothetical protein [Pseudomonas sp.]MDP2746599.1 hypothetical protein [Pseudomonas sp.]